MTGETSLKCFRPHPADMDAPGILDSRPKHKPAIAASSAVDLPPVWQVPRGGRREQVSTVVIPRLRNPAHHADDDPLAPMRGMAFALLLSAPVWVLIGLGAWFIH